MVILFHIGSIWFILSTSIVFSPHWSYSVQFGPFQFILSTLILICVLIWPYLVPFGPIWSTMFQFGPILSISSTVFLFGPILCIWSTLFIWSIQTTSVHFGPLRSIFVRLHDGKRYVRVKSTYSKSKYIYIF